jgi:hypothetical protein
MPNACALVDKRKKRMRRMMEDMILIRVHCKHIWKYHNILIKRYKKGVLTVWFKW